MSLVFATLFFFGGGWGFDVLILVDDVMAGPILGLKFLNPCCRDYAKEKTLLISTVIPHPPPGLGAWVQMTSA